INRREGELMSERVPLADSEWRLMQIIWEKAPCTFRQICDAACKPYSWTKYVVVSYLKRMEAKGAIRVKDAKPVKLYYPLLDREEAICTETEDVLDRVYNGDFLLMVQSAARARGLSEKEISELEQLLRTGREKNE
ncbi:MAG TPA: BlaI/MecI/CopY family transcriptional regulator, partial [Clostridia bacterium]|nr:BlaI/MecI/CopY family transcriptional regulator [Clostridia bacterium]